MRKESFLQKPQHIQKEGTTRKHIYYQKSHLVLLGCATNKSRKKTGLGKKKTFFFHKRTYNCYKSQDLQILRILNTVSVGMLDNTKFNNRTMFVKSMDSLYRNLTTCSYLCLNIIPCDNVSHSPQSRRNYFIVIMPATIKEKKNVRDNSSIQNLFFGDESQIKEDVIQFQSRKALYDYGYLGNPPRQQN